MLGTVLKRLAQGIFVTFCVIFISFVILRMIPGDPAKVMAPTATVEQQQAIRDSMGLEKSIPEQFKMYMVNLFHGDLGESYFIQSKIHIVFSCGFQEITDIPV